MILIPADQPPQDCVCNTCDQPRDELWEGLIWLDNQTTQFYCEPCAFDANYAMVRNCTTCNARTNKKFRWNIQHVDTSQPTWCERCASVQPANTGSSTAAQLIVPAHPYGHFRYWTEPLVPHHARATWSRPEARMAS